MATRTAITHALLTRLEREYTFFHREPNPRFPDGCLEFSLRRRWPCAERPPAAT